MLQKKRRKISAAKFDTTQVTSGILFPFSERQRRQNDKMEMPKIPQHIRVLTSQRTEFGKKTAKVEDNPRPNN